MAFKGMEFCNLQNSMPNPNSHTYLTMLYNVIFQAAVVLKEIFSRYQLYDKALVCSFYPNVIFQVSTFFLLILWTLGLYQICHRTNMQNTFAMLLQ